MPHCACNYVPSIAENFDMGNICQLIAPRKLIIISGDKDPIFPVSGAITSVEIAKKAYIKYNVESEIIHITANGRHKFYPKEVWNSLEDKI